MQDNSFLLIILLVVALILFFKIRKSFKVPKIGSLALFTGAVKSGKTTCSLFFAYKNYKRILFKWKIRYYLGKILKKLDVGEKPLFYSNVPLAFPYVEITKEQILRKQRFNYGSVIYISEASLFADNKAYLNAELSDSIMLFNKLIGHMTKGGLLIYDTQAIGDLPIETRRSLGQYFYIHHLLNIPLFPWLIGYLREERYSEDGSLVDINKDNEDDLKKVFINKKIWKYFDCYTYSSFTDHCESVQDEVIADSLKTKKIISFRDFKGGLNDEKKQ